MKTAIVLLSLIWGGLALAQTPTPASMQTPTDTAPDRDSLLAAWESQMALDGTIEALDQDRYRVRVDALDYEGPLVLLGAMVRPVPEDGTISHTGFVEFRLQALDPALRDTQIYYLWAQDLQNFHYLTDEARWVSTAYWQQQLYSEKAGTAPSLLGFMLDWGLVLLLVFFILILIIPLMRQMRRARQMTDDGMSINQMARENLQRAAEIQQQVLPIQQRQLELAESNHVLLQRIAAAQEDKADKPD